MMRWLCGFVLLLATLPAFAQERILSYDSEVDVRADGEPCRLELFPHRETQ